MDVVCQNPNMGNNIIDCQAIVYSQNKFETVLADYGDCTFENISSVGT